MGNIWFKKLLGDLEKNIMEIMWEIESATVRDVYEELRVNKSIAYTTVMTVMNRLCDKGLLKKDSHETAFIYSYALSKSEFIHLLICEIIDQLKDGVSGQIVSDLVRRLEKPQFKV